MFNILHGLKISENSTKIEMVLYPPLWDQDNSTIKWEKTSSLGKDNKINEYLGFLN